MLRCGGVRRGYNAGCGRVCHEPVVQGCVHGVPGEHDGCVGRFAGTEPMGARVATRWPTGRFGARAGRCGVWHGDGATCTAVGMMEGFETWPRG